MSLPQHIRLRPLCDNDIPLLREIYCRTRETELIQTGWPPEQKSEFLISQFDLQHRYYQTHFPKADFHVIQYHEEDIGRLYVDWHGDELRLIDIALLPSWRGQGIGSGILHHLIDTADELSKATLLHVEANNPILPLYERLGFEEVANNGVYFKLRRQARPSPVCMTES